MRTFDFVAQVVVYLDSGPDVITLVIAVTGLVLGAMSFGWQLLSRRLEQPRLKLRLRRAWADPGSDGQGTA
jgi:hypothetical protein